MAAAAAAAAAPSSPSPARVLLAAAGQDGAGRGSPGPRFLARLQAPNPGQAYCSEQRAVPATVWGCAGPPVLRTMGNGMTKVRRRVSCSPPWWPCAPQPARGRSRQARPAALPPPRCPRRCPSGLSVSPGRFLGLCGTQAGSLTGSHWSCLSLALLSLAGPPRLSLPGFRLLGLFLWSWGSIRRTLRLSLPSHSPPRLPPPT